MDHTLLKRAALLWMRDLGATDAEEERWAPGGKADAFSEARQWVVECGNTPIRKLIDAVRAADGTRFTLVPYQRPVGDAARATGLIVYEAVVADDRIARADRQAEVRRRLLMAVR